MINTVPSFAALWLVPRLGSFTEAHPEIEIAIETDTRIIDLIADPVDLVIRHGLGRYEGLTSHWLMAPELVVVANPKLLQRGPPIERLADCLRYPLLHDIEWRDWRMLFEAMRIKASVPETGRPTPMTISWSERPRRAKALALVSTAYANSEIDSGRVVSPLSVRWPTKFAYYLVGRPQTFRRSAVRQFKTWILAEAALNGDN